jgi:hypothetical protein
MKRTWCHFRFRIFCEMFRGSRLAVSQRLMTEIKSREMSRSVHKQEGISTLIIHQCVAKVKE